MSFQAKLEIDGKTYNVLDCSFEIDQALDYNGRPSGTPRGGVLVLSVEFTKDTDLIDWAVSATQTKSGKVSFLRGDAMSTLINIQFSDAYCARLSGYFNANSNDPLKIKFKITAETLKIGDSEHKNNWPSKA